MDWVPVTPSDTVDLEDVSRGIYVGTTGDVEVITAKGRTVVIPNLVAGIEHGGRFTRIKAARTTATDIFVLY
jgi:formylmethanofuran dehydrogenase subunit B